MSVYLITGSSGAGKTAVAEELQRRGYTAYNTDTMPEVTSLYDMATGEAISLQNWPPAPLDTKRYHWNWDLQALRKLFDSGDPVFVAAITSNTKENLHLFDSVFVINPTVETIMHRLITRTSNNIGKHPDELAGILESHTKSAAMWQSLGATLVDGDQSLGEVVDTILCHIKSGPPG
ncbi:AAA family ATPase [Actinopolymorpha singaporensis]|uniref:Broad-specificity NMP kinase n=1 Tax=Actinopolymorpha singaporensis TaxID=117157 RepID=A0A1H1Q618_9ACTN|nr:AAA family ATPase [Actinopolymorpha singaporensis]SDS18958.1 Broad-specificity NMP kinase [Actinopolymorpha singaporensis]